MSNKSKYEGFNYKKDWRIYSIWNDIKRRCFNPKNKRYKQYGGRGITICKEWLNFQNFYDWSMKNGYNKKLIIDRINNDKNYTPNNCRWVSWKEQANNRSNNHKLTLTLSMSEWSELLGLSYTAIRARKNRGWSDYETLTKPLIKKEGGTNDK